jgi:membrane protease YdiL (CAAX protease family)
LAALAPEMTAQLIAYAVAMTAFVLGSYVYLRLSQHLRKAGGAVSAAGFKRADLAVALMLVTFFGAAVAFSVAKHPPGALEMSSQAIYQNTLFNLAIGIGLGAFLHYRGLRLPETFGLTRLSFPRVVGWAVLLFAALIPIVLAMIAATQNVLGKDATEQDLLTIFRRAGERGDTATIWAVVVTGVVVAPVFEELLFRGFFYGVGKRFVGPWVSGILTTVIFASIHGSLTALPGLLVLATFLLLAYERTGSLFVPMTMHALFNATSLGMLYLQVTGKLAP